MASKPTRKAGRPKIEIDWAYVGEMLEAGASAVGIAATIGCTEDTLYNRCKSDNSLDFSAFSQQKKAKGNEMLRVVQFQTAISGNVAMQIWLGKQRLGQSDKTENKNDDALKIVWVKDGQQTVQDSDGT